MSSLLVQGGKRPIEAVTAVRLNVRAALQLLGTALVRSAPAELRERWLCEGSLAPETYYSELLRLCYRLMLLHLAELRNLLHPPDVPAPVRELYRTTRSLERIARLTDGEYEPDATYLWSDTLELFAALTHGDSSLGLAPLDSFFDVRQFTAPCASSVDNRTFVEVIRLLTFVTVDGARPPVDLNLVRGEDLGSVYEELLELTPRLDLHNTTFHVHDTALGANARRTSGSYYTPPQLVEVVVRGALDRCINDCSQNANDVAQALLQLRVVDPACGTGHFLLAAARRIAQCLEPHLPELPDQPPRAQRALRQVIAHCIYGVDLNPTAVELCKANLWLEAAEPGAPLSLLDCRVQRGNALIGAPPEAITTGIPRRAWRAGNRARRGVIPQNPQTPSPETFVAAPTKPTNEHARALADVWCAAFFWPTTTAHGVDGTPTPDVWSALVGDLATAPSQTLDTARSIASQHVFFHWHLRFPDVFARGGFDVVLGNPPWIAHAGRAAQALDAGAKHFFAANYPAFAKYITTHGLFASVLPRVLRPGGYLGFVLPSSLSELDGYEPTRRAHDALCTFVTELTDFGEGRFEGVTQPCMALITKRDAAGRSDAPFGSPWPVARPDLSTDDRDLLHYIHNLSKFPAELFAERGLQSDPRVREHFVESSAPKGRFTVPVREGTDVREFELLPARFHVDPIALGKRLRPRQEFERVGVVVRQTARYPIAAVSDGLAFRNSLLACLTHPELSANALCALLNSSLVRWHHYMRFRDARQPILPQVKISHLRAIPEPPTNLSHLNTELQRLGTAFSAKRNTNAEPLRAELDALVAKAYGLTSAHAALIHRFSQALACNSGGRS